MLSKAKHLAARLHTVPMLAVLAALLLPLVLRALGLDYYVSTAGKIVVFAIAATSLNLVLGYGGMVSFGHAAFFGLGAYATGVLISEGVLNAGVHLVATVAVTALAALVIGAISLRTRGVYFIMITLAFGQMLFYLANSIKGYGGDEGLNIRARSMLGFGLDLKDAPTFYYVALAMLAATLFGLRAFVRSNFGRAIVATRDDDVRAEALGFATYRDRLIVFVAAGAIAGIAGALSVNQQGYVSPSLMHWTQSGTLMVMVILGGVASLWGGVLGAVVLVLLQETLSSYTATGSSGPAGCCWPSCCSRGTGSRGGSRTAGGGCDERVHFRRAAARRAALVEALRRRRRQRRRGPAGVRGRGACADRAQRRRQDDAGRTTRGTAAPRQRPHRLRRRRHHAPAAARARASRPDSLVPDHAAVSQLRRGGKRRPRNAGGGPQLPSS